ncbi:MAG: hypothetical protein RL563_39 [Pseudomonadota bacterium]|jgi:PII-like signaling protein
MTSQQLTLVRIYLREAEHMLGKIVDFLHDEAKVRGLTVLRGIEGFSEDGTLRTVSLLNLSLDLPLIIEFYDDPDKVQGIIAKLVNDMKLKHVISFPVSAYSCSTG